MGGAVSYLSIDNENHVLCDFAKIFSISAIVDQLSNNQHIYQPPITYIMGHDVVCIDHLWADPCWVGGQ